MKYFIFLLSCLSLNAATLNLTNDIVLVGEPTTSNNPVSLRYFLSNTSDGDTSWRDRTNDWNMATNEYATVAQGALADTALQEEIDTLEIVIGRGSSTTGGITASALYNTRTIVDTNELTVVVSGGASSSWNGAYDWLGSDYKNVFDMTREIKFTDIGGGSNFWSIWRLGTLYYVGSSNSPQGAYTSTLGGIGVGTVTATFPASSSSVLIATNGAVMGSGANLTDITAAQVGAVQSNATITVNGVTSNLVDNPSFTIAASDPNALTNNFAAPVTFASNLTVNGVLSVSNKAWVYNQLRVIDTGTGANPPYLTGNGLEVTVVNTQVYMNAFNRDSTNSIPFNSTAAGFKFNTSTNLDGKGSAAATLVLSNQCAFVGSNLTVSGTTTHSQPVNIVGSTDKVQLSVKAAAGQNSNTVEYLDSASTVQYRFKAGNLYISSSFTSGLTTNTGMQVNGSIIATSQISAATVTGAVINAGVINNKGMVNLNYVDAPVYVVTTSGTYYLNPTNGSEQSIICTGATTISSAPLTATKASLVGLYVEPGTNTVVFDTNVFNSSSWPVIPSNGVDLVLRKCYGSTMWTVNGPATAWTGVVTNMASSASTNRMYFVGGILASNVVVP